MAQQPRHPHDSSGAQQPRYPVNRHAINPEGQQPKYPNERSTASTPQTSSYKTGVVQKGYLIQDTQGKVTGASSNLQQYLGRQLSYSEAQRITGSAKLKTDQIVYRYNTSKSYDVTGEEKAKDIIKKWRTESRPSPESLTARATATTLAADQKPSTEYLTKGNIVMGKYFGQTDPNYLTSINKNKALPPITYEPKTGLAPIPTEERRRQEYPTFTERAYDRYADLSSSISKNRLVRGYNRIEQRLSGATTKKLLPSYSEVKGSGIEKAAVNYVTPLQVKALEGLRTGITGRKDKPYSDQITGALRGIYTDIRQKPLKQVAIVGTGLVAGALVKTGSIGVSRLSSATLKNTIYTGSKIAKYGVIGAGVTSTGIQYAIAPTYEAKGEVLGKTGLAVAEFGLGYSYGTRVPGATSNAYSGLKQSYADYRASKQFKLKGYDTYEYRDLFPRGTVIGKTTNDKIIDIKEIPPQRTLYGTPITKEGIVAARTAKTGNFQYGVEVRQPDYYNIFRYKEPIAGGGYKITEASVGLKPRYPAYEPFSRYYGFGKQTQLKDFGFDYWKPKYPVNYGMENIGVQQFLAKPKTTIRTTTPIYSTKPTETIAPIASKPSYQPQTGITKVKPTSGLQFRSPMYEPQIVMTETIVRPAVPITRQTPKINLNVGLVGLAGTTIVGTMLQPRSKIRSVAVPIQIPKTIQQQIPRTIVEQRQEPSVILKPRQDIRPIQDVSQITQQITDTDFYPPPQPSRPLPRPKGGSRGGGGNNPPPKIPTPPPSFNIKYNNFVRKESKKQPKLKIFTGKGYNPSVEALVFDIKGKPNLKLARSGLTVRPIKVRL